MLEQGAVGRLDYRQRVRWDLGREGGAGQRGGGWHRTACHVVHELALYSSCDKPVFMRIHVTLSSTEIEIVKITTTESVKYQCLANNMGPAMHGRFDV